VDDTPLPRFTYVTEPVTGDGTCMPQRNPAFVACCDCEGPCSEQQGGCPCGKLMGGGLFPYDHGGEVQSVVVLLYYNQSFIHSIMVCNIAPLACEAHGCALKASDMRCYKLFGMCSICASITSRVHAFAQIAQ
jgi:hypothetical protein